MKATLEFNLPDDQMEFNRANQSLDMACALFDILQLRKTAQRKFENDAVSDAVIDAVSDAINFMADEIADILDEHNINIDRLIE